MEDEWLVDDDDGWMVRLEVDRLRVFLIKPIN
jgi:hypothetical protein